MNKTKTSKDKKQGVAYSYAPVVVGLLLFGLSSARPVRHPNAVFPYEFDPQNAPFFWNFVSGGLICLGFGWRLTPEAIGHKLPDWGVAEKVGEKLLSTHNSINKEEHVQTTEQFDQEITEKEPPIE